jgi:hypothetical protein
MILKYTEAQFVLKAAGQGALFGAIFGAMAGIGAGGVAIAALAGLGLSTLGIVDAASRLVANPHNECAWWDLGLSIFGLVASGFTLKVSTVMFYNKAVQFSSSRSALIGKYKEGSPLSYEQRASNLGLSHLNLEKPLWNQFQLIFGKNAWWKLINEPFIRAIARAKKTMYLSTDPVEIRQLSPSSNLFREFNLLKSLGYKEPVVDSSLNLWIMSPP